MLNIINRKPFGLKLLLPLFSLTLFSGHAYSSEIDLNSLLQKKIAKTNAKSSYQPYKKSDSLYYVLPHDTKVRSITVKFKEGIAVRVRGGQLKLAKSKGMSASELKRIKNDLIEIKQLAKKNNFWLRPTMKTRSSVDSSYAYEERADKLKSKGEKRSNVKLADLNNFYRLEFPSEKSFSDISALVDEINNWDSVEIAYANGTPAAPTLPSHDVTMPGAPGVIAPSSTQQGSQGYLSNTNNGIHAVDGWARPSSRGETVKIVDIERAMTPTHEDLPTLDSIIMDPALATTTVANHGTSVMGIMAAMDNGTGITGIAPEAAFGFHSTRVCLFPWWCWSDPASAIGNSIVSHNLEAGDILVIEVHVPGPVLNTPAECALTNTNNLNQCNFVPAEWEPATFAAVQTAVANEIVVVAAAGNGGVDLDDPIYNDAFDANVRDSGATLVGAMSSDEANGVMPFSNFGSRVSHRGWGQNVATLGNGQNTPTNSSYTTSFSGTSSATPIVAGAMAIIQSVWKDLTEFRDIPEYRYLNSTQMRFFSALASTPQTTDTAQNVGVMINLDGFFRFMRNAFAGCEIVASSTTGSTWDISSAEFTTKIPADDGWYAMIDLGVGVTPSSISNVSSSDNTVSASIEGRYVVVRGDQALNTFDSVTYSISGTHNTNGGTANLNCH